MGKRKHFSLVQRFKSFEFAFKGLKIMYRQEHNFRVHVFAAVLVVLFGIFFDISSLEWILITIVIGFVLVSEIFNSAVERIANFVSPEHHEMIGTIKDLCASMVLVAAVVSIIVGLIIFIPKF